jgi:hypothetical protein
LIATQSGRVSGEINIRRALLCLEFSEPSGQIAQRLQRSLFLLSAYAKLPSSDFRVAAILRRVRDPLRDAADRFASCFLRSSALNSLESGRWYGGFS